MMMRSLSFWSACPRSPLWRRFPLSQAHGRVLAEQYAAPHNIPAFNNAAVDGYAFAGKGLNAKQATKLEIVIRVAAGHAPERALKKGEAARIFTGAVMPGGADTCLMQEDAKVDGTQLVVPKGLKPGANTRLAGEDVKQGEVMLQAGQRLRPQDVAAIASGGAGQIKVFERLRVGLISTGDEIIRPGNILGDGKVYDSNHHLLRGLLDTVGAEAVDYGVIPDEQVRVERAVRTAAHECDIILTTGGASRGAADFIVETIQSTGHPSRLATGGETRQAAGNGADRRYGLLWLAGQSGGRLCDVSTVCATDVCPFAGCHLAGAATLSAADRVCDCEKENRPA